MTTPLSSRTFVAPFKSLKQDTSFYSDSALEAPSPHDPPPCFSDSNTGIVKGRSRQNRRQRAVILDFAEGDERVPIMAPCDEDMPENSDKRLKQTFPCYAVEDLDEIVADSTEKGDWVQFRGPNDPGIAAINKCDDFVGEAKPGRRRWQVEGHTHRTSSFLHKTRHRFESQANANECDRDRDQYQPKRVTPESRRDASRGRCGVPSIMVHCTSDIPGSSPHRIQYHPVGSQLHRSRSEVPEGQVSKVLQRPSTSESSSSSKTPKSAAAARSTPSHLSDVGSSNHSNSTSSNSWISGLAFRHKAIPRRQWSKPNPDMLIKFSDHTDSSTDEVKESSSHTLKTSSSQLGIGGKGSSITTDLSQLSRHPSLAGLLSSGSAVSKVSRKEEVMTWLKTGCITGSDPCSKPSPCQTCEDAISSSGEKSEEEWRSCKDGVDTALNIGYDDILEAECNDDLHDQKQLTLEIIPDTKVNTKIISKPRVSTPESIKSGSTYGRIIHYKKTSTFTNLESKFNKQCQSTEKMRKTRSYKRAWATEALENALNCLQTSSSKEKSALIETIGRLAAFYPEVAEAEQLAVVRSLASEIRDSHPRVVRLAVICLQWLFSSLCFNMVQGLTETYEVLLEALINTKCRLLKQDLWAVLDHLADIVVPQQAIQILVYLFHKYEDSQAQVAITRFLLNAIQKRGSGVVLLAGVKVADLVLQAAAIFAKSADPLVRSNGMSIIRILENHPGFMVAYKVHLSEETVQLIGPLLRRRRS